MTASTNVAILAGFPQRTRVELAIAVAAVMIVTLVVTEPTLMLLAVCIPLALLAAFSFDRFVYAVVFFLPWYPIHDIFLPTRFVFFAGVCILKYREGASLESFLWKGWLRKGALAFAAIVISSLLLSDFRTVLSAYASVIRQVSYFATFLGVAAWASTRERMVQIIKTVLVSTLGVCVFGFYQAFDGSFTRFYFHLYPGLEEVYEGLGGWSGRITSFLYHYNSLAGYLNTVIPLALGVAVLSKNRGLRALGFTCLCFSAAALYLTSSRGGLVACAAVALAGVWYLAPRRKTVALLLISVMVAASIALPLAWLGGFEAERLQNVGDFTQQSRLAMWGAAVIIFLQHPMLAAGVGTYRFRFHPYVPGVKEDLDAHNIYLHTLAEVGVVGFVVFFATLWGFFRRAVKLTAGQDELEPILGIAVIGAMAATMVHGIVDYIFLVCPPYGTLFWLLLGLSLAAWENLSNDSARTLQEA